MSKMKHLAPLLLLAFVVAGCKDKEAIQKAAEAKAQAFSATQQGWRNERTARLTRPDGWTSLVGLHWLEEGEHYFGSDADNGIRIAAGPAHVGMISRKGDRIRLVPEKGAAITFDGAPLKGAVTLLSDADPDGPSQLGFDDGKGIITVIKRADRYALRVKHADATTRTQFKGIEYWPGGADWIVRAKFVPNAPGKVIPIANIVGTTEDVPNPGTVEFERDGQTYRIEALDEGDGSLSLVFADRTSGHGSYPAGRFLEAAKPDASGTVVLDFNKSYNPPCAFTAFATCPLPPPENRLDLQIVAGEKTYHFEKPKRS
ncbi:DUF1684 domain-containing protein [Lysobacter solisilvae (ex Woo and Kim 2020)]|uniref:DUF1684 domain-containing protein n=1 Tax=Agrilutibacter terrestris TaxID=2865112 RepID=A0A7H0FWD1_9GAMM|nr:DUF1684 domain-containing protein [Lysobacter terrestris]QNP40347.1 DUF1684 domain-containing protein [Lysobacter terrestris]